MEIGLDPSTSQGAQVSANREVVLFTQFLFACQSMGMQASSSKIGSTSSGFNLSHARQSMLINNVSLLSGYKNMDMPHLSS